MTATHTYLIWDEAQKQAAIIDPVLGYDLALKKTNLLPIEPVLNDIKNNNLDLIYILETHAHADHLSSSQYIKSQFPKAKLAINKNIETVIRTFAPEHKKINFDILLNEDDILNLGSIEIKVLFTPGHTPACTTFLIENNIFVGDTIFLPDVGTGRCDFPGGSAQTLYHSIHEKLYKLDSEINVWVGHDYPPQGRSVKCTCRLSEQMNSNIHLKASTSINDFVNFREARDKTLSPPRLLQPSIQTNVRAGHAPKEWVN